MTVRHVVLLCRAILGLALVTSSLEAQEFRGTLSELGQIVDAAVNAVIPPEKMLTSHSVAERGVRFDYERTLAAFGARTNRDMVTGLGLRRSVRAGSQELLADCNQFGTKPCSTLGRETYVFLGPISYSGTEAVVWLTVTWAETVTERTFLTSFSTQVYLSRTGSGAWKFVRTGRTVVS